MKRTNSANLELCADVLAELLSELGRNPAVKIFMTTVPRLENLRAAAAGALEGFNMKRLVCTKPGCERVSFHLPSATFRCPNCKGDDAMETQ